MIKKWFLRRFSYVRELELDDLTKVLRRGLFFELLNREIQRAARGPLGSTHVGLLYLDLDRFKEFNDKYGHTEGDRYLRWVAGILLHISREHNLTVGRLGGDEFALFERAWDYDTCERISRNARAIEGLIFAKKLKIEGGAEVACKATVGYATTAEVGFNADKLIMAADHRMLSAKRRFRHAAR